MYFLFQTFIKARIQYRITRRDTWSWATHTFHHYAWSPCTVAMHATTVTQQRSAGRQTSRGHPRRGILVVDARQLVRRHRRPPKCDRYAATAACRAVPSATLGARTNTGRVAAVADVAANVAAVVQAEDVLPRWRGTRVAPQERDGGATGEGGRGREGAIPLFNRCPHWDPPRWRTRGSPPPR